MRSGVRNAEQVYARALVALMRGVVHREDDERLFSGLLERAARISDYVSVIGLDLVVDEAEGYAYLRQRDTTDEKDPLPRLVPRRPLSYPVSLLLVLLRREMAKRDAGSGETRWVVDRQTLVDMLRTFLPAGVNEARLTDKINAHINKVRELGFFRELPSADGRLEVRRVLKAYVDAQWLNDFDSQLEEYQAHLAGERIAPPSDEP